MTFTGALSVTAFCLFTPCLFICAQGVGTSNQYSTTTSQPLEGTWEGFMVGAMARGKITITIAGDSLHFHRDADFWFETTFTLPAGTDPKQLHATIKDCPPPQADSIGNVVVAIYKIEDGKLTLTPLGDGDEETPITFEAARDKGLARYELWKVQPQT